MKTFWKKTTGTHHHEWLSLIETAGVFFAVEVLERVLPQGLETVDTPQRRRLRDAYDEWRDAVDESDPQLAALHREWVRMVRVYQDGSLVASCSVDHVGRIHCR